MPSYFFTVYEVDSSYYYSDAQSPVLSKDTLEITDDGDGQLDRSQKQDAGKDQSFSFGDDGEAVKYKVQYLDYAQVNGAGPDYELYAMKASFADGSTKFYVMSKDENFAPEVGDDLAVTSYSTFTSTDYGQIGAAVCYASGTRIRTGAGETLVEQLCPGDLVQTRDHGCQEVLWVGRRFLGAGELGAHARLRPVLIRPGAFGNAAPLLVSRQHRMLIDPARFGPGLTMPEAFVKAGHLAEYRPDLARVVTGCHPVCYHHILLGTHEVIFANGAPSESFFPGPMALEGLSRRDRQQIRALCPDPGQSHAPARPIVPRQTFKRQRRERDDRRLVCL